MQLVSPKAPSKYNGPTVPTDNELELFLAKTAEQLSAEFLSEWSRKIQVALGAATFATFLLIFGIFVPSESAVLQSSFKWADPAMAPVVAAAVTFYLAVLYFVSSADDRRLSQLRSHGAILDVRTLNDTLAADFAAANAERLRAALLLSNSRSALGDASDPGLKLFDEFELERRKIRSSVLELPSDDPRVFEAHGRITSELNRHMAQSAVQSAPIAVRDLWRDLQIIVDRDRHADTISARISAMSVVIVGTSRILKVRRWIEIWAPVALAMSAVVFVVFQQLKR